jgi:hypothetical protein
VIRRKMRDWYTSTAYTRLMPGGRVVVIQTRWHEDDLAGWLLREHGHEGWDVLDLPALSDQSARPSGLSNTPSIASSASGKRSARAIGPRSTSKSRRPTRATISARVAAPAKGSRRSTRCASTAAPTTPSRRTAATSPFTPWSASIPTAACTCSTSGASKPDSAEWVETWCDLVKNGARSSGPRSKGRSRPASARSSSAAQRERKAYCARTQFPTRGDKAVRAQSIRGRMAMEGLYIPAAAPWRADFESELLRFPAGVHDDQVDAIGLIGQLLDHILHGTAGPGRSRPKSPKDYVSMKPAAKPATGWPTDGRQRIRPSGATCSRRRRLRRRRRSAVGGAARLRPIAGWSLERCKRAYLDYLGSKREEIDERMTARAIATARTGPRRRSRR